ncbi:hypothetical protein KOR42_28030 [Thalassoglobus neptunius]|uniref:Uncharacterized protein n=1 Tax=Thalassoglobus neptunius TaxID=1938619 RepID=A0A5C5WXN0_9PLAN|nr:hypothetical protein KOR42_28030 [Thalassoglobus neptunius]
MRGRDALKTHHSYPLRKAHIQRVTGTGQKAEDRKRAPILESADSSPLDSDRDSPSVLLRPCDSDPAKQEQLFMTIDDRVLNG